jgi:hypothetical protein
MEVIGISGNWFIQRRQIGIDQQMVMSGVDFFRARRRHAHAMETEVDGVSLGNGCAILEIDEIHCGTLRGRRRSNFGLAKSK